MPPRSEGIYISEHMQGKGDYSARLFKLEQVSGDGTAKAIELTEDEAQGVLRLLAETINSPSKVGS